MPGSKFAQHNLEQLIDIPTFPSGFRTGNKPTNPLTNSICRLIVMEGLMGTGPRAQDFQSRSKAPIGNAATSPTSDLRNRGPVSCPDPSMLCMAILIASETSSRLITFT
jgi:hypothetical protein